MADNAYEELFNCDVIDVNGDRVGSVGQVYLDDQTGQPSWVTVKTGLFGLKETFVPLEQAIVADGKITTPYSTEKIKDAPRVDPDKHLDADEEAQLYNYYGIATIVAVEPDAAAEAASEDDTADEAAEERFNRFIEEILDRAAAERRLACIAREFAAGGYVRATREARITTGLAGGEYYFRLPHLGATAWAVLAATGRNPFAAR